jgi:scyllo-inositol 2-dehydrogenase (NADP+)
MMIKAALIGLGEMGIAHQTIITAHPDVNLVAVCDVLELMEKYTGAKTYSDYRKCRYNSLGAAEQV